MGIRHAILALMVSAFAGAARADELRLDASAGAASIRVMINGRPAQLIVDTTLPAVAILTSAAAHRLAVRPIPIVSAQMEFDGDAVLRGPIARPEVVFANGRARRMVVALFRQADVGSDGFIGPGALGYDAVTFALNSGGPGRRARTIELDNASRWEWTERIGAQSAVATIDLGRSQSVLGRRLSRRLVEDGLLIPEGEVTRIVFRLGVGMNVQALAPRTVLEGVSPGEIVGHADEALFAPAALQPDLCCC